jgi:hypothetical protein
MDQLAPTQSLLLLMFILIVFLKYTLAKRQRRERLEAIFAGIKKPESIPADLIRISSTRPDTHLRSRKLHQ